MKSEEGSRIGILDVAVIVTFVVFVVLKLSAVGPIAAWSWWWVTSPIWIGWGGVLCFYGLVVLWAEVADLVAYRRALRWHLKADNDDEGEGA